MSGSSVGYATLSIIPSATGFGAALSRDIAPGMSAAGASGGASLLGALKKALPVAAVTAAVGGLFAIGNVFSQMDNTIRAGTGATGAALDSLTQSARNVGRQSASSFSDIGTTITGLTQRLGLTGAPLETLTRQFLVAGRITKEALDMGTVTASLSVFNITGEATSTAMDSLFRVSQATGVSMNTLASAVQAGAPVLQQFGFSFSDAAALMGTLDKAGLATSSTLAAMKIGLVNFAKAGKDPQAALKGTIASIEDFTKAGKDADALSLAAKIFGTRGATQFVAAVKSGTLNLNDLMAAAGAGEDTILGAGAAVSTFSGKWERFKNNVLIAVEPIATKVFDAFGTGMQWINDTGLPALQAFGSAFSDKVSPALTAFGGFITGTVIPAVQGFVTEFRNGEGAGGSFRDMLSELHNNYIMPLANFLTGTFIPGVQALVAAFQAGGSDITSSGFAGVMERIGLAARALSDWVVGTGLPALASLSDWITGTGVPALQSFKGWVEDNKATLAAIAATITTLLIPVFVDMGVKAVASGAAQVGAWLSTQATATTSAASQFASHYVVVGGWVASAASAVASGATTVAIWALYAAEAVAGAAKTVASLVVVGAGWIASAATATASGIAMAAAWVVGLGPVAWIIAAVVAIGAALVLAYNKVGWFRDAVDAVWVWIKAAASGLGNWFTVTLPAFFSDTWNKITGFFSRAWDFMKAVFAWTPLGIIVTNWGSIVGFFTEMPGKISSAVSGLWDGLTSSFKAAVNALIRIWNDFHLTLGGGSIMGVDIPSITLDTPNIPYLASGGTLARGGAAVVGERGAELATFPAGTTVHANGSVIRLHPDDIDAIGQATARAAEIQSGATLAGAFRSSGNSRLTQARAY